MQGAVKFYFGANLDYVQIWYFIRRPKHLCLDNKIPLRCKLFSILLTIRCILIKMSSVVANIVCSKCSKSFPSTLFTRKSPPNTFFKTCNNCRTRRKERRESNRRLHRRTPCLPVPVSEPIESVDGVFFLGTINPDLISI